MSDLSKLLDKAKDKLEDWIEDFKDEDILGKIDEVREVVTGFGDAKKHLRATEQGMAAAIASGGSFTISGSDLKQSHKFVSELADLADKIG